MKNQLFRISPDFKVLEKLLRQFGIKGINDNHSFTKLNLIDLGTVNEINMMKNELNKYYLPCKSKIYLINIDERKCITILRQFLKIHNHTLISKEKYIKGNKFLSYQVIPLQIDMDTTRDSDKVIISFD